MGVVADAIDPHLTLRDIASTTYIAPIRSDFESGYWPQSE